jgi:hypothetical protein
LEFKVSTDWKIMIHISNKGMITSSIKRINVEYPKKISSWSGLAGGDLKVNTDEIKNPI